MKNILRFFRDTQLSASIWVIIFCYVVFITGVIIFNDLYFPVIVGIILGVLLGCSIKGIHFFGGLIGLVLSTALMGLLILLFEEKFYYIGIITASFTIFAGMSILFYKWYRHWNKFLFFYRFYKATLGSVAKKNKPD